MNKKTQKWFEANIGKKIGKLTITGNFTYRNKKTVPEWRCECGSVKFIVRQSVVDGRTASCGCDTLAKIKKTNLERCGFEHPIQSPEIKEKVKKTNLKRYGTEYAAQSQEIQAKIKQINLDRHGVEYASQSKVFKEKIKRTNMERFGVENPMQSPEVQEKSKQTNLKRFGVEYPMQSPEVQEKSKQTNLERYGVEYLCQSPEIKEKVKKTNLKRYGTEYAIQSPEVREKIHKTLSENNYRSKPEQEVADFIESLGFITEKSYCGGANPCEIDIKVTDQNGNTVMCLEYNGDYFHSSAVKGKGKDYHLNKTLLCKEQKGVHLVHIFDSEWQEKRQIVENFIKSKLEKGQPIRASRCEVREIDKKTAYVFCEANHLQGRPHSTLLSLGLFLDETLLSVMTFSKPHRQNMSPEPHLSRYAILPGFRIHGGLSKLSQAAHSRLGRFITFVHYRLSDGFSYEKSGYTKVGQSAPDYFYWDSKTHKCISKQSRKKSAVNTPAHMTEREHAEIDGLFRIYDCGKIKFSFEGQPLR